MKLSRRRLALDTKKMLQIVINPCRGFIECRMIDRGIREARRRDVIWNGVGSDEIPVRKALHER